MATHAEVAPAALRWCDYGVDDDADIDALLRDIHAVVRPRTPAAADLPMPPTEFHARSRRHNYHYAYEDSNFEAVLHGIRSVRIPAASFASMPVDASDASPRTPAAAVVLAGPLSYGDDDASEGNDAVTTKTSPKTRQPPQYDYDADIDATFRTMETEAMEHPSLDYLSDRQAGEMMMMDRADLIDKMHRFSTHYCLAPGAFHRAVSFVDRFLSAKKINRDERQICLLGAAAVFAAAKYEDRNTVLKINSDHVAMYSGCTRSEAVDQERELVAVLGYRLSGPTAYTFVDHFMRHSQEEEAVRALAHHLADMALLDYRSVAFLPSAVAASAILLARTTLYYSTAMPVAGYTVEELIVCIQAIYDMHEHQWVWPGCAQMMLHWDSTAQFRYFLPPLSMLIAMH
ncbi:unnamed protein product [Miscanthus lutarioriparius]|uniref:Cyclin N-terminal domain-containing protein n=1 Tax=Miscanthus lutarioriparius TaxID=422564 RepID=A0A811PVS1_9POAL|nr:unnamed protein product [Miscanthus lutarioriparius]